MSEEVVAVVLGAGSSLRMGADKIWATLAGAPVLAHSVRAFARTPGVTRVVVVAPAERHADVLALLPAGASVALDVVEGGARRQDSVAAALRAAPDADWYLVHDGARPLVTPDLAAAVLAAARAPGSEGAAIPGVPVVDTIKRVAALEGARAEAGERVVETVDRSTLRAVQTPQAFRGDLLRRAHREVTSDATDDASMVETLGVAVVMASGDRSNIKITTPPDLAMAEALLAAREGEPAR